MRAVLVGAACLVGCGAPRAPTTIANHAGDLPRPRCDLAAIAAALRLDPLELDCTPGRYPVPGFFVEVQARGRHQVGILEADTLREVVPFVDEPDRAFTVTTIQRASADLDDDGIDEIVETWRDSAHFITGVGDRLVVRRLARTGLELVEGPHVAVSHPDLGTCLAEARVEEHVLVVVVKRIVGIPPSDCLPRGRHRFVLDGNMLVKAPTR